MTTTGGTPPGWYDDGSGQWRWYDGTAWTEHVHPPTAPAPEQAQAQPVAPVAKPSPEEAVRAATAAYRPPAQTYAPLPPEELNKKPKPFYARPIALVILLVIVIVAVALLVL